MKSKQPRFCYLCGGRLTWKFMNEERKLICSNCNTVTYLNSKPCVGALIIDKNKLLLARRKLPPFKNYWDIPGGFLEYGEHPEAGLNREVKEELGIQIRIEALIGIYMDEYGKNGLSTLNVFYKCTAIDQPEVRAEEIIELKWFSVDRLPTKIAFKSARKAIKKLLEVTISFQSND